MVLGAIAAAVIGCLALSFLVGEAAVKAIEEGISSGADKKCCAVGIVVMAIK
jgi:hypothetical protein